MWNHYPYKPLVRWVRLNVFKFLFWRVNCVCLDFSGLCAADCKTSISVRNLTETKPEKMRVTYFYLEDLKLLLFVSFCRISLPYPKLARGKDLCYSASKLKADKSDCSEVFSFSLPRWSPEKKKMSKTFILVLLYRVEWKKSVKTSKFAFIISLCLCFIQPFSPLIPRHIPGCHLHDF